MTERGEVRAAATCASDAPSDFDFVIGDWDVRHRRLNARLVGCTEWTEFDGTMTTRKVLGGFGNLEDNVLALPEGAVRAMALRSYDVVSHTWAIWWLDGRSPHRLDVPVIGAFDGSIGLFYADDLLEGRPVKVRFTWRANPGGNPAWEQAFSATDGREWETNWYMEFRRRSP